MAKLGIVLGSDSDLPRFKKAVKILEDLGVPYEITLVSAHRDPGRAAEYARRAEERGIEVLVAGAGMAAHLAGTLAAWTLRPVIGVPLGGSALGGLDALYATVQMPPGIPVATVGVDQAENGVILALGILALSEPDLREKLAALRAERQNDLLAKDQRLKELGLSAYLEGEGKN